MHPTLLLVMMLLNKNHLYKTLESKPNHLRNLKACLLNFEYLIEVTVKFFNDMYGDQSERE